MDVFDIFKIKIMDIVKKLPLKVDYESLNESFQVNIPREKKFGDISTNIALVLSKTLGINALELAQSIADKLLVNEKSIIKDVDIIKPGFINVCLHSTFWWQCLNSILTENLNVSLNNEQNLEKINIEYVSANPTGPMHIGHVRGAVIGDILANLYTFFGYPVTREYYINDAGNQINGLALSVYYQYCKSLGKDSNIPQDFYPGEYILDIAQEIIKLDGAKWLDQPQAEILHYFSEYSVNNILNLIKDELKLLGIKHDIYTSEKQVANAEVYSQLKELLKSRDLVYMGFLDPPKGKKAVLIKKDGSPPNLLFRTSKFGDKADRVVEKADGTTTYFANDICYHYDKLNRGFNSMIVVLGADHKGYEKRLQAVVNALSNNKATLEAIFIELVNLLDNGKPIKMSKRLGQFIAVTDVLNKVSKDIVRIMMISRSNTSTLDFDLSSVYEKSDKNPVFYIQYAYARINSVMRKAKEIFEDFTEDALINIDKSTLTSKCELYLIRELSTYQKVLKSALKNNNVHLLYLILLNISKNIHSWWSAGKHDASLKFINESNKNLTFARLSLLWGAKKIINILFNIIGIDKPEKM